MSDENVIRHSPWRRIGDHNGRQLELREDGSVPVGADIQSPLPTDGDSVYVKDLWISESDVTGWVDLDSAGGDVVSIPFNNLHTAIQNSSIDNPKTITIHFNRTVFLNQVGLGCADHPGESFSNVNVKILGSGGVERGVFDDSANDTKLTSYNYQFGPEVCNAVMLEFHTVDPVTVSNVTIQKVTSTSSILRATKPDGTVTDIDATQGGNLKVSLEEIESQISDDNNQRLMTAPYIIDEFDNVARLMGDNIFKGALVTLPTEHHEIHCGDSYEGVQRGTLGNGDDVYLVVVVPNEGLNDNGEEGSDQTAKQYHAKIKIGVSSEAVINFYEGAILSDNGTPSDLINKNRNSTRTDFLGWYSDPTITDLGTILPLGSTLGAGS
jgi:hypothetical protein